jgi:putative transposase
MFTSLEVIEVLSELFITQGFPKHIRSDNGPEFTLRAIRQWLNNLEIGPLFIEPGRPRMVTMNRSTGDSGTSC